MEIIIILLIAVEVTIVLIREGHELANMLKSYISPEDMEFHGRSESAREEKTFFGHVTDMAPRVGQAMELEAESLRSEGKRIV